MLTLAAGALIGVKGQIHKELQKRYNCKYRLSHDDQIGNHVQFLTICGDTFDIVSNATNQLKDIVFQALAKRMSNASMNNVVKNTHVEYFDKSVLIEGRMMQSMDNDAVSRPGSAHGSRSIQSMDDSVVSGTSPLHGSHGGHSHHLQQRGTMRLLLPPRVNHDVIWSKSIGSINRCKTLPQPSAHPFLFALFFRPCSRPWWISTQAVDESDSKSQDFPPDWHQRNIY